MKISLLLVLAFPLKAQISPSTPSLVRDSNSQNVPDSFPEELGVIGDKLYFIPPDGVDFSLELLNLDEGGFRSEMLLHVSTDNQWPLNLNERDSPLYFSATTERHGRELWKTDGTFAGTSLVKDTLEGEGDGNPKWITEIGSSVFFPQTMAAREENFG